MRGILNYRRASLYDGADFACSVSLRHAVLLQPRSLGLEIFCAVSVGGFAHSG
jgi:hypothetical protein